MTATRGVVRPLSELALVAVHVAVVFGFDRLYLDGSFLGPLLAFTFGAHALAAACRWRGLRPPAVTAIALVGGVLAVTWILFPSTSWAGLPTGATWTAAREAAAAARTAFPTVLAPTEVLPGFQLASGLALWGTVWFADWAAFRLRATVEAVAPAAVIFVFVSLLGSGRHEVAAAASFTAAVLAFVATHRALRAQLDQAWLTTAPTAGPRAVLRAGGLVAVAALVVGVVAGPHLPGASSEAVVEWRGSGGGDGPRVTISPMVELKKRLFDQSDLEVLEVRTNFPTYLRLTSLGVFDGEIFKSSGNYDSADDDLPSDGPTPQATRRIEQQIRIKALSDIWVPAAFQLRQLVTSTEDLRWESDSSTLIVDDQRSSDGLTYQVISAAPILDADLLRTVALAPEGDDEVDDTYLSLPDDFPLVARAQARAVTESAASRYDQARLLQDWFRDTFTYDLSVSSGHDDDALVEFLESKRGYCEQFAGAYAAMARTLGIPSRVAVGFTQGDVDPEDPTLYHVKGTHAHAWPELWFPTIGWVPFEPTPGRGMPGAEAATGVAPQQADEEPTTTNPDVTTTTSAGPVRPTPSTTPRPPTTEPAREAPLPPLSGPSSGDDGGLDGRWVLAGVAGLLAVAFWGAVLAAPMVRRRRRSTGGGQGAALQAWQRTLDPVRWATGLRPAAAETHVEFARRAAAPLGEVAAPFRRLADLATTSAWSDAAPPASEAAEADALADTIGHHVSEHEPRTRRLRRRLDWREAFGRPTPT